jgi:hypothetical protein
VIWELVFMLVILKIPVLYLCAVVWWAIKAEPPRPLAGVAVRTPVEQPPGCGWSRRHGPHRLGPPSGRGRRPVRRRRIQTAELRLRGPVSG